MTRAILWLLAALGVVALIGCGGGGATQVEPDPASLAVTVAWPARGRGIPGTAESMRLSVRQGGTELMARVLNRPASGATVTEVFSPVPAGALTVAGVAHAQPDGGGAVVATARAEVTIAAGQNLPVALELTSTIVRIAVTPGRVTLGPGETATLTATALDAQESPVPVNALTWRTSDPGVATVANGRVAAVGAGEAEIAVEDPESGATGSARVTVHAPASLGRIAFLSNRDGNDEVYIMNADGSNQRRLTNTSAREMEPWISPDGSRVAYCSNRDGRYQLYIVNADGTGDRRLTNDVYDDWGPTFSRDGRTLYFFRTYGGQDELMAMSTEGGNIRRLTNNTVMDVLPTVTPDGEYVIYNSRPGALYQLWRVRADGSGATRLLAGAGDCWYHDISRDGTRIVYTSGSFTGRSGIAVCGIDGGNPRDLTNPQGYADWRPAFSPDGRTIVFASNRDGDWALYTMPADGGAAQRLTNTGNWYPSWGG